MAVIFRSRDYKAIRELCLDPSIFPYISDDFTADASTWKPIESDQVVYLLARDAEGLCGFGIFLPDTWACWKAHVGFLPRSYGSVAFTAFKEMVDWMWTNTKAERIVGEIVQQNRRAIQFVTRVGFRPYGVNEKSYRRGGQLLDQVCLGISKPKAAL